ncbi:hypothetical protein FJY63_06945 [Candidatus Sumerlaeota bacterium]|nr:hypothetical protein [Candidatus Sumerlaeota bacterium]
MNLQAFNKEALAGWLRGNFKIILAAMDGIVLLVLLYLAASWLFFEVRTRHLLGQMSDSPSQTLDSGLRPATNPHSAHPDDSDKRGESDPQQVASANPGEHSSSASGSDGVTTASALQNPASKKGTYRGSSAKSQKGRPGGEGNNDEEKKKSEQIAQLEKRGLFGEPRPNPPQYNLEGILGNAALINGEWVTIGKRIGELKVAEIDITKVVLEDNEGNKRDLTLLPGEGGGGMSSSGFGRGFTGPAGSFSLKSLMPPPGSGGFPQIPDFIVDRLTRPGGLAAGMSREELMEQGRKFFEPGGPGSSPQIRDAIIKQLTDRGGPMAGMPPDQLFEQGRRFFEEQQRARERMAAEQRERFEPRPPPPPPGSGGGPQIPDSVMDRLIGPGGRFQGMSREELMERFRRFREEREQRSQMPREEEDRQRRAQEEEDRRRREMLSKEKFSKFRPEPDRQRGETPPMKMSPMSRPEDDQRRREIQSRGPSPRGDGKSRFSEKSRKG